MGEGIGDDADDGVSPDIDEETESGPRRRPYASWFKDALDTVIAQVEKERKAGISCATKNHTFWYPSHSPYFSLNKTNLRPQHLFTPLFFIWDPLDHLATGIACPNCCQRLTRDGIVKRPRRVVDLDHTYWIIGYSYACKSCNLKMRSWDKRVLQNLPRSLSAEFPAHLTWRSALSKGALGVLRSCIQNGMGAHQVADMFRMQHLRRYDELRLQYLQVKVARMDIPTEVYEPFPDFDDMSDTGFHGFVPSAQWLRDIYDSFIELHKHELNQHTAMLSARVSAIDHSHKVCRFDCCLYYSSDVVHSLQSMFSRLMVYPSSQHSSQSRMNEARFVSVYLLLPSLILSLLMH